MVRLFSSNFRACTWAEHLSGAENGAERAENWVERSGRGRKRWNWRSRSGNGAGIGMNRPLTARSNLTFHWHRDEYSLHSIIYSLLFQSSLFYFSCTRLLTCSNPYPAQHFTYKTFYLWPSPCILNKTQSISSTWHVLVKYAVWTISKIC